MLSKKRKGRKNKDAPADLPVLLISGKDDPVGDMGRGVERLAKYYKGIGVKNVSVHLIEGSRHEFLNEAAHREEGLAAIAEFIKRISVRKK